MMKVETIFGGPSYPETIVLRYQKGMAKLDRDNKALRADLKVVAVAARAYLIDRTAGGALIPAKDTGSGKAYDVLTEALALPSVRAVLEGVKDG